jgi:KDO2-lipid IV(A) lauroyltransferase
MGYKALLILEKILMALPKKARKRFFDFLAFIAYNFSSKYRKIVRINLQFTLGDSLSEEEIKHITKYTFKNLLYNFMHLMEMKKMSTEEFKQKVKVKNFHYVQEAIDKELPIVHITPHYCSWELAGASLAVYAKPATLVYKHLKNREYEKWLLDARSHFGNKNIEKTNVLKKLIKLVRSKESIGILIDTKISKSDGVAVKFFDKTIHQTPVPAFLARKLGAVIIPAVIRTDDDEHYEVIFYEPIKEIKTDDEKQDIQAITQAQASWLEGVIRKEPKFWFWLHKRFKGDYPEIYEEL